MMHLTSVPVISQCHVIELQKLHTAIAVVGE